MVKDGIKVVDVSFCPSTKTPVCHLISKACLCLYIGSLEQILG